MKWLHRLRRTRATRDLAASPARPGGEPRAPRRVLFSDQQLRDHARRLSRTQKLLDERTADHLAPRLLEDETTLDKGFHAVRGAAADDRALEPAAEWLVDNFYVIKEQIKEIRTGLPRSYRRELPVVAGADGVPLPRIQMLMQELVEHADGRIHIGDVRRLVAAYQEGAKLTLGELWAIPLMLRFALIERLRPLVEAITQRLADTVSAATWADRILEVARTQPADLVLELADMARSQPSLSPAWVAEFHRRMHGGNPALNMALAWLDQQLAARHLTMADALEIESRSQAAAQVSVSNCVAGLRLIGRNDWAPVVESLSSVDDQLSEDPAGVYAEMDFTTRDRYRHVIEAVARRTGMAELEVACRAVDLAANAGTQGRDDRARHVGFWLIGDGRRVLEKEFGVRRLLPERVANWLRRRPSLVYVGQIVVLTLAIAVVGVPGLENFAPWHGALVIVAMLFAASHVSVAVMNWLITLRVPPQMLCRLALQQGMPDSLRTLVAVPCMLVSKEEIRELVTALEIRYLANRDDNLFFALVADFVDANAQSLPVDGNLLRAARTGIEALNARYDNGSGTRFLLCHRARSWNAAEQAWMGGERKRGKLAELNNMLLGHDDLGGMRVIVGNLEKLLPVKYVIALDADTELPPQSAIRLVATMAHPLNRPRMDTARRRVVEGYGVLQPRVSVGASRESASMLARLHSDEIGLDPYTRVVSDVYQDLFGEASFVGKGIYDVEAFAATTGARFPDNLILSHDLIEGSYARTGLVSDVELFEHHPDRYSTEMRRRHRWIRGDWQVAFWLLPWVPGPRGHWVRNSLSGHHRWKMLDNLRRSMVPGALLLVLLDGWLLSERPLYWTAIGMGVLFTSPILISIKHFLTRNRRMDWRVHFQLNWEAWVRRIQQTALMLVMLPYEAFHHLDAIARSLWRVLVSHRHCLQWTPSSESARDAARGVGAYYRMMWTAPALAVATAVALLLLSRAPPILWLATPVLLLWFGSPWIASIISRSRAREQVGGLSHAQRAFLGGMARRTWHYFEHFVDAESHFLPPDNFQEYPSRQLAHRTSPTNIGMYLTSAMSAADFGYITSGALLQRIAATVDTLEGLERYRGHFFNWYDTHTLEPLSPAYVSSVDSGNLLGCLLVVARGLSALDEERLLPRQAWRGLRDTWRVFSDTGTLSSIMPDAGADVARAAIDEMLAHPPALGTALSNQARHLALLGTHADELSELLGDADAGARFWLRTFREQCRQWRRELDARAPWLRMDLETWAGADTALAGIIRRLEQNPSWRRAAGLAGSASAAAPAGDTEPPRADLLAALAELPRQLRARQELASALAERCRALCNAEFGFLSSPQQRLLSIGYNVDEHTRDNGAYDLLASEARLTSFVAIAQGKLPRRHWFALSRLLTLAAGRPALVSWSGSMFEYLMPLLLMPSFDNTLLTRTCRAVIERQIGYARERGVPWGISESAYNITDANLVYQYRAFGVPGLGLKRGLADDLVIAPYASAMALLLSPDAAARNLKALHRLGASGAYGFYESIDYTPARVPADAEFALVRAFMAHHQGMIMAALSSALNNRPLQRRFMREPMFRANQLLLQEKVPAALSIDANTLRAEEALATPSAKPMAARVITRTDTRIPQMQLLSNGRYHVLISQAGGGYSQWRGLQLNHWSEDATRDNHGMFCYVQDLERNLLWSNTLQPTLAPSREYAATFAQASAEFYRRDHGIETWTRIAVSSEDDIELRRVRVTNRSGVRRRLALTSYLEWVMTPRSDVESHPVFNKLFVETEFVEAQQAVLARRRARANDDEPPVFMHLMGVRGQTIGTASHETRRDAFIGRHGSRADPQALRSGAALANVAGAVLDPVAALRREVTLEPGESATMDIVTGAAADRAGAMALVERYADRHLGRRVFDLAWTREQVIGHQLSLGVGERQLFARLASSVIYTDPELRTHAGAVSTPTSGQSGLWKYGISGDLPIVLLRVSSVTELPLVKQTLQAHAYWHMHGLRADLVIWNEDASGYRQELHDRIMGMVGTSVEAPTLDRPGGVFVRRSEHVSLDDRGLLLGSARMVLDARRGSLADQIPRIEDARATRAGAPPVRSPPQAMLGTPAPANLAFFNGSGGYSASGNEYVIWLPAGQVTPRPWVNVLANPGFGSVVSERGGAYTFSQNAHEFRLTPWYNDPVTDESGEAIYLRDEGSGTCWSPAPWPARGEGAYVIRHGFGYSSFQTVQAEIDSTLTVFVARELPLKYSLLSVRNTSRARRTMDVFGFVEWVLGEHRSRGAPHIRTAPDRERNAIYAVNPYNDAFGRMVGWFATSMENASGTGSRSEFIGRNRNLHDPLAVHGTELKASFGSALDPCAAWQSSVTLMPGETMELVFVLGAGTDIAQARQLVRQHVSVARAHEELDAVVAYWRDLLGRIRIDTPDAATNLLVNGWLTYQVVACRLWARSGFYQSGGAYGFRDQLQDTLSLLSIDASFAREQILRCAAHQFADGDVQHWWHPPHGRGVRTNFSDDFLWLPWALAQYIEASGDTAILDQMVPFLEGRPLGPNEESYYDFAETGASASIYEHCRRALLHGLRFGQHGLPLMGAGDWNDGMNRVGRLGRGESVWLGFFLVDALRRFAPLAQVRGDSELHQRCLDEAAGLAGRIAANAWDGAWYRRAYTDDGTALGSAENEECQIDSLPQSWAALTGVGSMERRKTALDSALQRLVRPEAKLVQLFDPPFDRSDVDPGYIKGYIPGTRENGGQYTHAAVWLGMACAQLGRSESAWRLLEMINPINHARDPAGVDTYRVEPYVVVADVYWAPAHRGLGGWSWYTGSAGWMYRFILESLLGVYIHDGVLRVTPCLRADWPGYRVTLRHGDSEYAIEVRRGPSASLRLDGKSVEGDRIVLTDDGGEHRVEVVASGS